MPRSRRPAIVSQACRRAEGSKPVVGSSRKSSSRVADQRHADVEAALLTAGERAGTGVGLAGEADLLDRLLDRPRRVVVAGVEGERLAHGQVGIEAATLQDDADPLAPGTAGVLRVLAEHAHLADAALAVALEDLHRGRLARAVGPEEGEDFPPLHLEIDAAHRLDVAVAHAQAANGDDAGRTKPTQSMSCLLTPDRDA